MGRGRVVGGACRAVLAGVRARARKRDGTRRILVCRRGGRSSKTEKRKGRKKSERAMPFFCRVLAPAGEIRLLERGDPGVRGICHVGRTRIQASRAVGAARGWFAAHHAQVHRLADAPPAALRVLLRPVYYYGAPPHDARLARRKNRSPFHDLLPPDPRLAARK